ncbi:MAG: hypothetical protein QG653_502 [Patescibacteria group bacterium]|nr:hypothetical protein [Patescibacteria group bacterium]
MGQKLWNIFWAVLGLWIFFEVMAVIFPGTIGAFKRTIGYSAVELGGAAVALTSFQMNLTMFVKGFVGIAAILLLLFLLGRYVVKNVAK